MTFLCYDIKGIQRFIFSVPRLKCIVGGSALIDEFDRKSKLAGTGGSKHIFSGGGRGAFYTEDCESSADGLSGYKVYRTSNEVGESAPWKFSTQGVYDDRGELKAADGAVNKTCDLLPTGEQGTLNIAFMALTKLELALLIQACSVAWRLGGGKPLGLGRCKIALTDILNEEGETLVVKDWLIERQENGKLVIQGWEKLVQAIAGRVGMWIASQLPVERLRYPRAVD